MEVSCAYNWKKMPCRNENITVKNITMKPALSCQSGGCLRQLNLLLKWMFRITCYWPLMTGSCLKDVTTALIQVQLYKGVCLCFHQFAGKWIYLILQVQAYLVKYLSWRVVGTGAKHQEVVHLPSNSKQTVTSAGQEHQEWKIYPWKSIKYKPVMASVSPKWSLLLLTKSLDHETRLLPSSARNCKQIHH